MPDKAYYGKKYKVNGKEFIEIGLKTFSALDDGQLDERILNPPPNHLWEGNVDEKPKSEELKQSNVRERSIYDWPNDQKLTNLARAILWNYKHDNDLVTKYEHKLIDLLKNASSTKPQINKLEFYITDADLDKICC